jgi:hypothetical protein
MGRTFVLMGLAFLLIVPSSARGQAIEAVTLPACPGFGVPVAAAADRPWNVAWTAEPEPAAPAIRLDLAAVPADETPLAGQAAARPRPVAIEFSPGYETRRTIHKWAAYATVPLLVAEFALGQSLYNTPAGQSASSGTKTAHAAVAGSIVGLFGVNTVTGIWNLREVRRDPVGRTRRTLHALLMLAADGEFAAAAMLTPNLPRPGRPTTSTISPGTHRAIAVAAIGTATVGYLVMLLRRD